MRASRFISCIAAAAVALASLSLPSAIAARPKPPTLVSLNGDGTVTVWTTINRQERLDTFIYINNGGPPNFIYQEHLPATLVADPAWDCPCTAQVAQRNASGTLRVLTAESEPFVP